VELSALTPDWSNLWFWLVQWPPTLASSLETSTVPPWTGMWIKVKKINNIIAAWKHRDLSYKGRPFIFNSVLPSTLWYNVTSQAVPLWAITQIEQAIYSFFWDNKHPLVNREILALPNREGGVNFPPLQSKIQAFRLNTLRRLLSEGDAHWKNLRRTSCVSRT